MNRNDENILKVVRQISERIAAHEEKKQRYFEIERELQALQKERTLLQQESMMDPGPTPEELHIMQAWARGEDVVATKLAYERDTPTPKPVPFNPLMLGHYGPLGPTGVQGQVGVLGQVGLQQLANAQLLAAAQNAQYYNATSIKGNTAP